jgi:hypothetical protein
MAGCAQTSIGDKEVPPERVLPPRLQSFGLAEWRDPPTASRRADPDKQAPYVICLAQLYRVRSEVDVFLMEATERMRLQFRCYLQ